MYIKSLLVTKADIIYCRIIDLAERRLQWLYSLCVLEINLNKYLYLEQAIFYSRCIYQGGDRLLWHILAVGYYI